MAELALAVLIEQHAQSAGLGELKTSWQRFAGGNAMNEAILSNSIDFIETGPPSLIILWDKSRGSYKGLGGSGAATMVLVVLGVAPRQIAAQEALRWGADEEGGAPYIFKDPRNPQRNLGFEVDLKDALARELGRPIHFKQYEFNSLFSGLERGDFDFAMNGLEITADRKAKALFTRPYYVYRLQFVTRVNDQRFHVLQDCAGRKDIKIGTLEDTAAERLLDRLHIPKKIYSGQVEPYSDLALGRLDGVLLDLPIALYYARDEARFRFAGPAIEPGYYAIAVNLHNEALVAQLNAALDRLFQSGEMRRIDEKWKLWNDDQQELLEGVGHLLDGPFHAAGLVGGSAAAGHQKTDTQRQNTPSGNEETCMHFHQVLLLRVRQRLRGGSSRGTPCATP